MKAISRLLALLILVGQLAAVTGTQAKTINPHTVNLKLSDLPTGFTLDTNLVRDNKTYAKENKQSLAQVIREGRLTSNEEDFSRNAIVGMVIVRSTVELLTTPANAAARLKRDIARAKTAHQLKPMSVTPVGAADAGWEVDTTSKGIDLTSYVIEFIRGPFAVQVITAGVTGTFAPEPVRTLAADIDKRIKATM